MITIYKYRAPEPGQRETHSMDPNGRIVALQLQTDPLGIQFPEMWVIVDTEAEPVLRSFVNVGTGQPVGGHYVGTYQEDGYVWHVFEVTE